MKQNKILSAAILAALAVGSGNGQAAPTFEMAFITDSNCNENSPASYLDKAKSVAMESVGSDGIDSDGTEICTKYITDRSSGIDEMFYISYTLTGGKWENDPSTSDFKISSTTNPGLSSSTGSETTAKFLITPSDNNSIDKNNPMFFKFKLDDLEDTLQEENGVVSLEAELLLASNSNSLEKSNSLDLMKSVMGTKVTFTTSSEEVKIDVAQGGMKFTGSTYGDLMASLGTLKIEKNPNLPESVTAQFYDSGWKDWDMDANSVKASDAGVLKITNGPFAASQGDHDPNSEDFNDYFVFLAEKCALTNNTIPATEIEDDTTARWDFEQADIVKMVNKSFDVCVRVLDTNSTQINETTDAPETDLLINYEKRDSFGYSKTKLYHITRNGTVCSLYNVPPQGATDLVNIRITNLSNREGILMGQLKGMDGKLINKEELDLLSGEKLQPNATVRITADNLKTLLLAEGHETGIWTGRAVLTISSDLTNMEVFGLLRNSGGGPLLNMSVGGSGDGCD